MASLKTSFPTNMNNYFSDIEEIIDIISYVMETKDEIYLTNYTELLELPHYIDRMNDLFFVYEHFYSQHIKDKDIYFPKDIVIGIDIIIGEMVHKKYEHNRDALFPYDDYTRWENACRDVYRHALRKRKQMRMEGTMDVFSLDRDFLQPILRYEGTIVDFCKDYDFMLYIFVILKHGAPLPHFCGTIFDFVQNQIFLTKGFHNDELYANDMYLYEAENDRIEKYKYVLRCYKHFYQSVAEIGIDFENNWLFYVGKNATLFYEVIVKNVLINNRKLSEESLFEFFSSLYDKHEHSLQTIYYAVGELKNNPELKKIDFRGRLPVHNSPLNIEKIDNIVADLNHLFRDYINARPA